MRNGRVDKGVRERGNRMSTVRTVVVQSDNFFYVLTQCAAMWCFLDGYKSDVQDQNSTINKFRNVAHPCTRQSPSPAHPLLSLDTLKLTLSSSTQMAMIMSLRSSSFFISATSGAALQC